MKRTTNAPLLDPDIQRAVVGLRLVAHETVTGFLAGGHLDARPGVGVEFSQYRPFERGDDPRRIDWRAYARNDRRSVREAEVERDVTVRFLLDASASMGHRDGNTSHGVVKLDYARRLVAALAYLADTQGDRVALHLLEGEQVSTVTAARAPRLLPLLTQLAAQQATGAWPPWSTVLAALPPSRGREIVVVVSDLYQATDEMETTLAALRSLGNEVVVCHVMARNELDFSFTGDVVFEDLETGARVRADARAVANDYRAGLDAFLDGWKRRLFERGIDYHLMPTDQALDVALRALVLGRQRLR